jgi:hypothetical protein
MGKVVCPMSAVVIRGRVLVIRRDDLVIRDELATFHALA